MPRASTVVTVFAGGNDTNAIGTAVERGAGGGDPDGYIDAQVRSFASDYAALVRGIRQRAPSARIVAMNLPNMAGLPYAAGFARTERQYLQRISVGFSREGANALVAQGVVVVDLLCDPRSYQGGCPQATGSIPTMPGTRSSRVNWCTQSGRPATLRRRVTAGSRGSWGEWTRNAEAGGWRLAATGTGSASRAAAFTHSRPQPPASAAVSIGLRLGDAQLLEPHDDVLRGGRRLDLAIDVENLAVGADVERPAPRVPR